MAGTTAAESTQTGVGGGPARRRVARLSLIAAVYTYALIVFGGIVRITGSGMGCGDDWPRCNGEWIPTFTLETFIEYMHRLLAAGIGLVVLAVLVYALLRRTEPGVGGKGGMIRPLLIAAVLLLFQAALGAVTVRLELPTSVTVAHFVTAMVFMATLLVAATRGGAFGEVRTGSPGAAARKSASFAITTAMIGLVVVGFGAVTANAPGAPAACTGFPLCSGWLIPPAGAVPAEIHWAHRMAAFVLLFVAIGGAWAANRAAVPRPVRRAAAISAGLVIAQIATAAALVLLRLPQSLQTLHLAVGTAVWFALVVWAALARLDAHALDRHAGPA